MADDKDNTPIINWTHATLTLNICNTMMNADINGHKEKFYKGTFWFLHLLIPYLTEPEKNMLNEDFALLEQEIKNVKNTNSGNDEAQQKLILNLQEQFARRHSGLGFSTFNRSNIVWVSDDGDIDFNKLALEKTERIVRIPFGDNRAGVRTGGLGNSVENELKAEEKDDEEEKEKETDEEEEPETEEQK